MARFYGTVEGGRGVATRLGHASSGLKVTAQSYTGDVHVRMFVKDDEDWVYIRVQDHNGNNDRLMYRGPIAKLFDKSERAVMMTAIALDMLADA